MIVVTGATGFVGRAVVQEARAAGHEVRAIVRDPRRAQWLHRQRGVELIHGNVLHAPSLEGAMDGAKVVIHLVGIINEWRENTFERVHSEATATVVNLAKKAGVRRLIHMSALGTRDGARSRYHQTKWAAEQAVRQSGLAWTIFRPSLIYGSGDISVNVLARMLRWSPFVPVIGNGRSRIQPVSVEVVARCFVAAIHHDESVGKIYDLCGPVPFCWNELYDKLLKQTGLTRPKVHLPLPLARCMGAVFEKLHPKPPFNREQVLMAQEDNIGDPLPAERDFGVEQVSFEAGIARYLV